MENRNSNAITIKGAHIIYKNFKGEGSAYNREGDRNFSILFDYDQAQELLEMGLNLKVMKCPSYLTDQGEIDAYNERPNFHLPVAVKYGKFPPDIYLLTEKIVNGERVGKKTLLNENTVSSLDYAYIKNVDLVINPYHWKLGSGKEGIKAYLKKMYVLIEQDELAQKYSDYTEE